MPRSHILSRSVHSDSPHAPTRMRSNSRRFSATERARYGENGSPGAAASFDCATATCRHASISALDWWHTNARPARISWSAIS
jgi:hypothetical protein